MLFIVSLSAVNCLLEGSQNLPVTDTNKSSKNMISAALIAAATAVPSYMYYRWSSTNQKETQRMIKDVVELKAKIKSMEDNLQNIQREEMLPLPKEYEARKEVAMKLRDSRINDADFIQRYGEFKKFIAKFAPPVDAQADLIKNEQSIYKHPEEYNTQQDRFYVKAISEFDRIINIERMKKLIAQRQLKHITVPNKYVFFIGDQFMNIADKLKPYQTTELVSKAEVEELANFIAEIGYSDFTGPNIFRLAAGKWAIIDTEDGAFIDTEDNPSGTILCRDTLQILLSLKNYIGTNRMTQEALTLFESKIKDLEKSVKADPEKQCGKVLTKRTDLDDPTIDMMAAKRYAGGLNSRRWMRGLYMGQDPFNQKTREDLTSELEASRTALTKLETKLALLQKTWYTRVRDSWSNFWSASRAKVASWRWW